jgi:hypothetical protein
LPEYLSDGTAYQSTNGTVDNEDIYGPNGILDAGEDVIDFGWDANLGAASKKALCRKTLPNCLIPAQPKAFLQMRQLHKE